MVAACNAWNFWSYQYAFLVEHRVLAGAAIHVSFQQVVNSEIHVLTLLETERGLRSSRDRHPKGDLILPCLDKTCLKGEQFFLLSA